jgi:hypothetical protein
MGSSPTTAPHPPVGPERHEQLDHLFGGSGHEPALRLGLLA